MPADRRRFLQGAVLGIAGAPLLAKAAAAAAGPDDPGERVLSGRLTGAGDQLQVQVGGRRVSLRADRSTSVWRGGESLLSQLGAGDDVLVRVRGDRAVRVWANLTRLNGTVVRSTLSGYQLRSRDHHGDTVRRALRIADGAMLGDQRIERPLRTRDVGDVLADGTAVDVIGEALPGGAVRVTRIIPAGTGPAAPAATAPAVAAPSYEGFATWYQCADGGGTCGTCSGASSAQGAWPKVGTCACSGGCASQVALACGAAVSVRSLCLNVARSVTLVDCGACSSTSACGQTCADCQGRTGMVIALTAPTFTAFGYDPALQGCFSCTVATGGTTGTRTWPVVKNGDQKESVRTVQYLLNARGVTSTALATDGIFGSGTLAAVQAFQTAHGLAATGVVDGPTWEPLVVKVRSGSLGDAVRAVQSQLNTRGAGLTVDGDFGSLTVTAVKNFQTSAGLTADGIVGPYTWCPLVGGTLS
ncbi:MAG: peptidoglycan-binding protein [Mycobacteriales bacterium]